MMTRSAGVSLLSCSVLFILYSAIVLSTCVTSTHYPAGKIMVREIDGAEMVFVPEGSFMMGSTREEAEYARRLCVQFTGRYAPGTCSSGVFTNEQPAHPVALRAFYIDKTEVTNRQYRACVEAGVCTPPEKAGSYTREQYYNDPAYDNYPVIWITQEQAESYCAWVGGRLPTEAEWEYAARGPDSLVFPWGNEFDGTRLNYCDLECGTGIRDLSISDGYADTAPVGSYPSGISWCGALDMAGNVREWVGDWYGPYADEGVENPTGPVSGNSRIPKGGSWLDKPDDVRSANRGENSPDYTRHKVGFRCVTDAEYFDNSGEPQQ